MINEFEAFYGSKLGLGTFLGNFSEEHSLLYREAVKYSVLNGMNFIDTSTNYRGMRSERDIGIALCELINEGLISREEIVISSKAGIIPGDGEIMKRPINYMEEHLIDAGILKQEDVYMVNTLWLTMNPEFFKYALELSRKHMKLETIDIYYIHETELSMKHYGEEEYYKRLKDVFIAYEEMVSVGKIREYGMATWDAFQLNEGQDCHISLEKVMEIANEVSKEHHFKHLMFPVSLDKTEAVSNKSQAYNDEKLSIIECAKRYDVKVHSSGSIGQGQNKNPDISIEDYIKYVANVKNLDTVFIGSKQVKNIQSNLASFKAQL